MQINNRKVINVKIEGESDDLQIMEAYFKDNGIALTDNELDKLQEENPDALYNLWFENQINKAEYLMED